jgi:hypothetical protein
LQGQGDAGKRERLSRRARTTQGDIMKIVYTKPTLTKAKVTLQAVTATINTSNPT